MAILQSSLISFRTTSWVFLLVLIYFLLLSSLPVEAQAPTKKNAPAKGITLFEKMQANPWAKIKGFRSAKFGANQKSVSRAIAKDFKLAKNKIKIAVNPAEQTTSLQIKVPDLFETGGTALVSYILGYKSKKLIHVNVLWGQGAAEDVDGAGVVQTANTLRTYFLKKRYLEDLLVVNGQLSPAQTLVFRGKDQKNRMVSLLLNTSGKKEGETPEQLRSKISLLLSYIIDPVNPDIFSVKDVKEGDF